MTTAPSSVQESTSEGRLKPDETGATRYLCAAAYLDQSFARAVLDEVLYQPHRAVAPSHGISIGPVIRHCLAAQRRRLLRDSVVAGLLVLGLLLSFSTGLPVVVGFLVLWLIGRTVRAPTARQRTAGVAYLAVAVLVLPLLVVVMVIGPSMLTSDPFGQPYLEYSQGSSWRRLLWIVLLLLIWVSHFAYRLAVHRTLAVELSAERYDPRRAPTIDQVHEQRVAYLEQAQYGNVTIYSEATGSRPFIGFGEITQEWALAASLQPAASPARGAVDAAAVRPNNAASGGLSFGGEIGHFTVDELYEAIRTGMAQLCDPRLSSDEVVPQLSVRDRVFIAGRLPPNSPFLDRGLPRYRLREDEMKQLQRHERGPVRHYQTVRMAAWGGEVEVTTFVYATVRGRMLYVEFIATLVPGIWSKYHSIDTYDRLDASATWRAAVKAVVDVIGSPLAMMSVLQAARAALMRAMDVNSDVQRINRQLMFDYGCRSSVRELATNFSDVLRLQTYDANERVSVVERRLLKVLITFLTERGFDVTDIAGQAATVINNSTRINNSNTFNNSTLNSSSVAAGSASSAHVTSGAGSAPSAPAMGPASPKGWS